MRPQKYQKFPLFGKESPRRGDSLDRFPKCLGAFIRLNILHQCFKFHVIPITGYGVIAEKPRVGKLGQFFSVHVVGKTIRWIEKWMTRFMMGTTRSITMQSFSVVSDGATTERQIYNRVFWSISYQFEEGQRRQLCTNLKALFGICQGNRCSL